MVDDVFRFYPNHDTVDPEGSEQTARGEIGDPLAELARLTGQPYGGGLDGGQTRQRTTPVPSSVSRARSTILPSSVPNHPLWRDPNHPLWRDSAGSRRSRRPPDTLPAPRTNSNGVPENASDHPAAIRKIQYSHAGQSASPGRDDQQPALPTPRTPTFLPAVSDDRHDHEMQSAQTDEIHRADSFCNAVPRPRWGRAMVIAVLGLAWLGAASAFSYFAVFGGEPVLPTLPPLVAADNGPKEIVPNYGDARSNNLSQRSMVNASSSEKFVSRWPADNQEPPKTALTSSDPSTLRPAASTPSPSVAPLAVMALSVPASERKKVHTIIIRSGGSEQTDTSAAVAHSATSAKTLGMR